MLYVLIGCIAYGIGGCFISNIRKRRKAAQKAADQKQRAAVKAERERDKVAKAAIKAQAQLEPQAPKRKRGRPRKEPAATAYTPAHVLAATENKPNPQQNGERICTLQAFAAKYCA